jgi:hypothetical protein
LEVFRLRLGKALDFDYFEDWQGSLFSRADPRNGGPSLDVERAMNKLEKVAIRYARKNGRPLVLAFNSAPSPQLLKLRNSADIQIFICFQIHRKDMVFYINFRLGRKLGQKE